MTNALDAAIKGIAAHESGRAVSADCVVGLSETAINKFLVAHFDNNTDFYDHGRDKGVPIYRQTFNDHGTPREIKFFARIVKDKSGRAVVVDLLQTDDVTRRFTAWWRATHGGKAVTPETQLPPNVALTVPHAILQLNFPRLDGSGKEHEVDFHCTIMVRTFAQLVDSEHGDKAIRLVDWDLAVQPANDPLDPNDPIWGVPKPGCEAELARVRLMVRDAFTMGANVALTELAKKLTRTLPFPPLDVIKGFSVIPRDLYITERMIALGAAVQPGRASVTMADRHRREMEVYLDHVESDHTDLEAVLSNAPVGTKEAYEEYLLANLPAYRALSERHDRLVARSAQLSGTAPPPVPLPDQDLLVMLSGTIFDMLAKQLLTADKSDCTPWLGVDILLGYARGRACYWFSLANAHGGLAGVGVNMGCNVRAGGGLELQACIRIPCAPDQCATWKPGLGLKGPLDVVVRLGGLEWDGNKALVLSAHLTNFPGLEVYGLPPVVGDLANKILNYISSVIFKTFFNAILSAVHVTILSIPVELKQVHVTMKLSQFGAANIGGMLAVVGTTTFS